MPLFNATLLYGSRLHCSDSPVYCYVVHINIVMMPLSLIILFHYSNNIVLLPVSDLCYIVAMSHIYIDMLPTSV